MIHLLPPTIPFLLGACASLGGGSGSSFSSGEASQTQNGSMFKDHLPSFALPQRFQLVCTSDDFLYRRERLKIGILKQEISLFALKNHFFKKRNVCSHIF